MVLLGVLTGSHAQGKLPLESREAVDTRTSTDSQKVLAAEDGTPTKKPWCCDNFKMFVASVINCENQNLPFLFFSILGGTPPYTGSINVNGDSRALNLGTLEYGHIQNGTYIIRITDKNGCTAETTLTSNNQSDSCNTLCPTSLMVTNIPISLCEKNFRELVPEGANGFIVVSSIGGSGIFTVEISSDNIHFEPANIVKIEKRVFGINPPAAQGTFYIRVTDTGNEDTCTPLVSGPITVNNTCIKACNNPNRIACCCK